MSPGLSNRGDCNFCQSWRWAGIHSLVTGDRAIGPGVRWFAQDQLVSKSASTASASRRSDSSLFLRKIHSWFHPFGISFGYVGRVDELIFEQSAHYFGELPVACGSEAMAHFRPRFVFDGGRSSHVQAPHVPRDHQVQRLEGLADAVSWFSNAET